MDGPAIPTVSTPRAAAPEEFAPLVGRLAVGLALVSVLVKVTLLPFPVASLGQFVRWLLRLAVVASADLAFVAALASCALALGWWLRRKPRAMAAYRCAVLAVFQLAGLYAVASVAMFRFAMVPLTVELLSFAGGPVLMASSLAEFFSPLMVLGLVAAGWWLAWLAGRQRRAPWWPRVARPAWLVVALVSSVAAYASACQGYIASQWTDPNRWERRIACSPGAVFLGSCAHELFRSERLTLQFHPSEVDLADFVPPAEAAPEETGAPRTSAAANPFTPSPQRPRPRNLITIVLESVGAKHLALYGARYQALPYLSQLASRGGILFENAYAHAPSSPKGLVALTASVYPRVDWKLITRDSPEFHTPLLPQVLAAAGYRTAYLHSGYWSWKRRDEFLRRRGVERLVDAELRPQAQVFSWGIADRELFGAALDWIDEAPDRPFHALLWTIETHHPYVVTTPRAPWNVDDPELDRYLSALRNVDATIEWLVAELEMRGLANDTLIAVTGDHGEAFGEHQQRAHSFAVYEENVHVPWLLVCPGWSGPALRVGGVCQQIDIAPTCLGCLGVAAPEAWQGRDVLRAGAAPRAYFYSVGNEAVLGLREGSWKYHYHVHSGLEELFDLERDPGELNNRVADDPALAGQLRRRVAGLVRYQREFLAGQGSP